MYTDIESINWPGWETVQLIGRGSFGAVYEIQRDIFGDVEKAALKVISIPQNAGDIEELYSDGYDSENITTTFQNHLKSIVAEYSLMRKMNGSANIVNCDDIRYIQHDDGIGWDIFIKMELLTPLPKALKVIVADDTVIRIAKDMCAALDLCRKHGIIHRDIKPQNIFVSSNGDYKLGDFGIAKTVEKTSGGTKIGTYKYMAPEVFHNQPYGHGADIYSLGLVLYWLLNERRMPFLPLPPAKLTPGMEVQARSRRLSGEKLPPPVHGSEELKRIVLKACAYNPKDRYQSAQEMLEALHVLQPEKTSPMSTDADVDDADATMPLDIYVSSTHSPGSEATYDPSVDNHLSNRQAYTPSDSAQYQQNSTNETGHASPKVPPILIAAVVLIILAVCFSLSRLGSRDDHAPIAVSTPPATTTDSVVANGTCGDNLTWEFNPNGTLIISGTGAMTNFKSASQVPWKDHVKDIQSVVIENGVTSIGGQSFYACENLANVSIPDSVTDIRGFSFCGCTSLTEIVLPVYLVDMGGYVFSDCTSLTNIVIPDGMTVIPGHTFRNCINLKEIHIPASVHTVQRYAFSECNSLKRVYYGAKQDDWNALKIKDDNYCLSEAKILFEQYSGTPGRIVVSTGSCGSQLTWTFFEHGTLMISGTGEMTNFSAAPEVPWRYYIDKINNIIIQDGVSSIGGHAFYNCSNLVSVHIPDSVTDIRGFAFSDCRRLSYIFLPDSIAQMGGYIFLNCTSLTHIELPDKLTIISGKMFSDCTALKSITIPKTVTEIHGGVFNGCDSLEKVLYSGNSKNWESIEIDAGNDALSKAVIHYSS